MNGSWNSQFARNSATPLKVYQPQTIQSWCFFNFATTREDIFQSFVKGLVGKSIELGKYLLTPPYHSQLIKLLVIGMSELPN